MYTMNGAKTAEVTQGNIEEVGMTRAEKRKALLSTLWWAEQTGALVVIGNHKPGIDRMKVGGGIVAVPMEEVLDSIRETEYA